MPSRFSGLTVSNIHLGSLEEPKAYPVLRCTWVSKLMTERISVMRTDTLPTIQLRSDRMKKPRPDSDVGVEEAILEDLVKSTSIGSAAAEGRDQACKFNITIMLSI